MNFRQRQLDWKRQGRAKVRAMMTGCIVGTFLLAAAAAATPLPVNVENWPGADKVAVDTLTYARWAFWATLLIGIPSLLFGVVDYALNMRQFRQPKLLVGFQGHPGVSQDIGPYTYSRDNTNYEFTLDLELRNLGKRASVGCYVSIWIPREHTIVRPGEWKPCRDLPGELGRDGHKRFELLVTQPIFVDHPVPLSTISVSSPDGPTTITITWRVYDETGIHPRSKRASTTLRSSVRA